MGKERKQHSGDFKARVALDAIKGQHTLREISARYRIHPNMVVKWKKRALDDLSTIFAVPTVVPLKLKPEPLFGAPATRPLLTGAMSRVWCVSPL